MFVVFVQKKLSSLTNELNSLKEQRKESDMNGISMKGTIGELRAQNAELLAAQNELKSKNEENEKKLKKDHEVSDIFAFLIHLNVFALSK